MEIEKIDMKEAITREFENDPIYKMCLINNLTDEDLFTQAILGMHPEASYSTVETGKIIGRPDSTIRNHFRTDLIDYIEPERFGKYYRMNYRSVFKLHMIFMLMEKCGKGTVDILVELGTEPAVSVTNGKRLIRTETLDLAKQNDQDVDVRLKSLEEMLTKNNQFYLLMEKLNSKRIKVLSLNSEIQDLKNKIESAKSMIDGITYELRIKYLEEKQTTLLSQSLKGSLQKPSFFGSLFGNKNQMVNVDDLSSEISKALMEKFNQELQSKSSEENNKIQMLQKELDKKNELLEEQQKELDKLEAFSSYLLEHEHKDDLDEEIKLFEE